MKRLLTISIAMLLASSLFADDACYNAYLSALKSYKAGDYVDAQRKFIIVAQTCGNYQEVYQKMKDCNAKLKEKQTQNANEITTLNENVRKLTEQYNKLDAEHKEFLKKSALNIKSLNAQVADETHKADSLQNVLTKVQSKLADAQTCVDRMRTDSSALRVELDKMTHQRDSLLEKGKKKFVIKRNNTTNDETSDTPKEGTSADQNQADAEKGNATENKKEEQKEVEQEK